MTRVSGFNSPLLVGFEHVERLLDRVQKSQAEGYPPYNIEQRGATRLRITLAVAGFTEDDLSVSVEENQLVIRGRQVAEDDDRLFLHRGIAARQFQRAFVLAEGMEILGASLENGLLHIDLDRPVPEPRVRRIQITNKDGRPPADGRAGRSIDVADREGDPV